MGLGEKCTFPFPAKGDGRAVERSVRHSRDPADWVRRSMSPDAEELCSWGRESHFAGVRALGLF